MTHEATGANLADGLDTQAASQAASPVVLDVRGLVAEVQSLRDARVQPGAVLRLQ